MTTFEKCQKQFWALTAPVNDDPLAQTMLGRSTVAGAVLWRALGVVTRDPRIRAWLEANDPQALGQALAAALELWAEEHPAVRP